jgi:leucokinin receptor
MEGTSFTTVTSAATDEDDDQIYQIGSGLAIFLTIVYLSVSLCAIIGNWMVVWIVMRSRAMRSVTNAFIANLAVADLMIGLLAIPFQFQAALLQKWLLPHFLCSVCPTAQTLSLNLSIFTLVTLSVDRHRAVTQPLKPRISRTTGLILLSVIWILAVMLAVPTFLAFEIAWMGPNGEQPQCLPVAVTPALWKTYNHILVSVQYVVPFFIISAAYIHMASVLSSDSGVRSTNAASSSKRRVIKMLFMVISIFAICWFPFQLYNILQEIYPDINT